MCGLSGLLSFEDLEADTIENLVFKMGNAITHRGPDDSGIWIDSDARFGLAHKRLSIIDLSTAGHQPMKSSSGRYVIAFNGEIYNHLELRNKLFNESKTSKWIGSSDTETLITCIETWGLLKTLEESVGMFAFALWDRKKKSLTLVRDRFGEKPLYFGYTRSGTSKTFLFGSELSSFRACDLFHHEINKQALTQLFRFSAIASPLSIYEGINQLKPGSLVKINYHNRNEELNQEQWWDSKNQFLTNYKNQSKSISINKSEMEEKEYENLVEESITKSILQQSVADVKVGTFLSGGIDSSLITTLLQRNNQNPINTFTIGFEESNYNEAPFASEVAKHLGTNHTEIILTSKDAINLIPDIPNIYSEPFADSSQIPTHLVCREAKKSGLKVVLTGDGGDELFGGYTRYVWGPDLWQKLQYLPFTARKILGRSILSISSNKWDLIGRKFPINNFGHKVHKLAVRLAHVRNSYELYCSLVSQWEEPTLLFNNKEGNILINEPKSPIDILIPEELKEDKVSQMMLMDILNYLPNDILTKVDRAAMSSSLETRAPLLDHRVAEIAWGLPMDMKVRSINKQVSGKWILRKILNKYLPKKMFNRPKTGFGIPIGEWLRGPLKEWSHDLLSPEILKKQGYLNPEIIKMVLEEHMSRKYDHTNKLWSILMWQGWLGKWH
tara:strand:- start:3319 stop:5325 length:2007 start_codon:yes stop_codon:yes gene_type:complete